jgi:hypothetical protein
MATKLGMTSDEAMSTPPEQAGSNSEAMNTRGVSASFEARRDVFVARSGDDHSA